MEMLQNFVKRIDKKITANGKISGQITYQLLGDDLACIDLQIKIDKQQFKQMMKHRNEKSMLVIMVDRSGSMSGKPIQAAHEACLNFGLNFFQKEDRQLQLSTIFFDENCQVDENIQSFDKYQEVLRKHCVANHGTLFVEPLKYLFNKIKSDQIHSVQVLFITDGEDKNKDATLRVVKEMKTFLQKNQILSRFNVMGIGVHESQLLSEMVNAGTDIGNHCYLRNGEKGFFSKMKQYIKNILNESIWQKGIQIKLPDNRFVYISRGNVKEDGQYLMNRCGIIVNSVKSPADLTKIVVCQPFKTGLQVNFKIQKHQIKEDKLVIPKVIHRIAQLDFANNDIEEHSRILTEIEEEISIIQPQDEFDKIEQQRIQNRIQIMQESIQYSSARKGYDNHSRAVIENARNELIQRNEWLQYEVKFRKDSDVHKGALFLIYKAVKNDERRIFVRALGRAIQTMDLIVKEFVALGPKNYYNVDVSEEVDKFNNTVMKTVKLNIEKLYKPKVSFDLIKPKDEIQNKLPLYTRQKFDKLLSKAHDVNETAKSWFKVISKPQLGVSSLTYILFNDQHGVMFNQILAKFNSDYPEYKTEMIDERVYLTEYNTAALKRIIKFKKN